jgi:hypothetical protein
MITGFGLIDRFGIAGVSFPAGTTVYTRVSCENNFTTDKAIKVLFAFGTYDEAGGTFSINGYLIYPSTLARESSGYADSPDWAIPNLPGTWDCLILIADDFQTDGTITPINTYDIAVEADYLTITGGAAGISIASLEIIGR